MSKAPTPKKILFVCLGNICRSPAAEIIFKQQAKKAGLAVEVDSAGTANYHVGSRPDRRMLAALEAKGYTYEGQRGRQFCRSDLSKFDLIIPQDEANRADILTLAQNGEERAKVIPMSEWFPPESPHKEVPDPYYGGEKGFYEVIELLSSSCEALLQDSRLQPR